MARATGWTYLSKIASLVSLILVAGVLAAGFLLPYVGGAGYLALKATNKFNDTICPLNVDNIDPPEQTTTMYASDGKTQIATFFNQNRVQVAFNQIPTTVVQALVDTEDKRFYSHHGVDLKGLIRAALKTSNGDTQGGSTLTEQYVKQVNYYAAISKNDTAAAHAAIDQTADRKIADAKCALEIEKVNTKNQILEKYLNIAYFGENAYGIEQAAKTYFNVDANKLTIAQGAMIVGLVKSPSSLDPYNDIQAARARRDLVIQNMLTQKDITAAQAATATASPIVLAREPLAPSGCYSANKAIINVGFFCDYAYKWLTTTGGLTASEISTGGLKITTTLQVPLQNRGQTNIANMGEQTLSPTNDYLLVMPSVQPHYGWVTSMITDKQYGTGPGQTVNPVFTSAYAGSGSTYKYFTTIAALSAGVDPNFTLTAPSPYKMKVCNDAGNLAFQAKNAGNYGTVEPLSYALPASMNTYFVAMEDQLFGCNIAPIVNTATSLGMNALLQKNADGKTVAQALIDGQSTTFTLGEEQTSALELTSAYSALANNGVYCPPTPIMSITSITDGKAVPFKKPACTRVFSPYVANTLVNIMTHDTTGSPGTAYQYFHQWYNNGGSQIAAKTGTNNAVYQDGPQRGQDNGLNSALWFVGVTPNLTSAAALVNATNPGLAISDVPGVTVGNSGGDTFGAYSSQYWLAAYGSALSTQQWKWQTTYQTPGGQVPFVQGQDPTTASTNLTNAGFKPQVLGNNETCGSNITPGNVAYYSPKIAQPGDTVYLCLSSGLAPVTAPKPTVTPTKPTTPPTGTTTPPGGASAVGTPVVGPGPGASISPPPPAATPAPTRTP